MKRIVNQIIPFIVLGITIVALVAGLILFSYLLVIGATVGLILFAIVWIKERFFSSKKTTLQKRVGRTIDH